MYEELKQAVKTAAKKLFDADIEPELSRPDEKFGDYATNAALQLAKKAAASPNQIARQLIDELKSLGFIADISSAAPGFINFRLTDKALAEAAFSATDLAKPLAGQEVLVEFGDPNPFKEMHIGHLYSYIVGDSIARLLEASGAQVKRLSYHGDVGLHVAKAIYGLKKMSQSQESDDKDFMGAAYAFGSQKYESDTAAKTEIEQINKHVYQKDNPAINELHEKGVKLSFDYFDKILNLLSIYNDKRYFESQTAGAGKQLVEDNIGSVFAESQRAIIYEGEKSGLHTRVFITSKGLPTYEAKDLGLVLLKDKDFPQAVRSIVITANEQSDYFKVMLAALAEIKPELAVKTSHLSHGFLSLTTGKMSSRTGDVYSAKNLLDNVQAAVEQKFPESDIKQSVYLAATRYSMLKHRLGQDIVIDVNESVSIDGNSGPYLQYAHARARSILAKLEEPHYGIAGNAPPHKMDLIGEERSLALRISEYPEVVAKAANELMPHHICTYLYELAQNFNRFYEHNRVLGDEREQLRYTLVESYSDVLKSGLNILNIEAPEKM